MDWVPDEIEAWRGDIHPECADEDLSETDEEFTNPYPDDWMRLLGEDRDETDSH